MQAARVKTTKIFFWEVNYSSRLWFGCEITHLEYQVATLAADKKYLK